MASADPILTALGRLEERLGERLDQRLGELRLEMAGHFDAVHHRLERLETEYEMLKLGVARLEVGQQETNTRLTRLETAQQETNARLTRLDADVEALQATVQRIEAEIRALNAAVERVEADHARSAADRQDWRDEAAELRRRLAVLDERVKEIETRLARD